MAAATDTAESGSYQPLVPDTMRDNKYPPDKYLLDNKYPWRWTTKDKKLYIDSSKDTSAGIQVSVGAYMAVVMAAFGGVRAKVSNSKTVVMHPLKVLILVAPLFVVQMTTIFALRLDLDVSKGVMDTSILESETKAESMTALKCLMVLVVQLTSFGAMLGNMRMFMFVFNPITWFEIDHPHPEEWLGGKVERRVDSDTRMIELEHNKGWLSLEYVDCKLKNWTWLKNFFHPIALAIPCVISLAGRFGISYLVCVDSMSIIFAASTMTEAIFNALVLNFIFDLNEIYWKFLSVILNLDEFEFQLKVRAESKQAIDQILENKEKSFDALASDQDICFKAIIGNLIWYAPFLSTSRGWRRISNSIAFLALFFVYLQQLFVVIFALATNVLPVARDMCTMWRWSNGETCFFKKSAAMLVRFVDMVTLVHIDIDAETKKMPIGSCRPAKDDDETGMFGIYYRMVMSDRWNMVKGAPYTVVKTVLENNEYTIIPGKEDHNCQWTSIWFWVGFAFILAIVTFPQLSSFRDLSLYLAEEMQAFRTKVRPSHVRQLGTEDPQMWSSRKSRNDTNANIEKDYATMKDLEASNAEMKKTIAEMKASIDEMKASR